ncbi:MAG TPA: DMT family protein [Chthoniobacterales bacterium]|nr:DMT family protein [Chthoniobacterales bacterium]
MRPLQDVAILYRHRSTNNMLTILLLTGSNIFMTFAWYGHLKYGHAWPLWKAIVISWLIAFVEYCFAVPANRWGFGQFNGFQLKIIQEAVTLAVFIVFAATFLKERIAWNYLVSFVLLIVAVVFAFAFKPGGVTSN